jgi:hypothetical protein
VRRLVEERGVLRGEEDESRAGIGERREEALRLARGEVHLEGQPREGTQSPDRAGGKRLVQDGVPVEDVQVEEVDARGLGAADLISEPRVVRVEESGSEAGLAGTGTWTRTGSGSGSGTGSGSGRGSHENT